MDAKIARQELRPGKARLVSIDGEDVAVFQIGSEYFAVDNHCPHQHFSKLHEGGLEGSVITCPMHGWSFDLASGACVNGDGRLKKYAVTHDRDFIIVKDVS